MPDPIECRTPSDAVSLDASILLATRNRAATLERTLAHLGRLATRAMRWEVLVVDNGSSDATPTVLERARSTLPLHALSEPVAGKSRALNRAIPRARGRLLVFTDDDVIPDPAWLASYHAATRRWPRHTLFSGPVDPLFPPGTPSWLADPALEWALVGFAAYRPAHREGEVTVNPVGPNFAVDREVMRTNPFDESIGACGRRYAMGEDTELMRRLRARGSPVVFVPEARVQHVLRPEQVTLRAMFTRSRMAGRGWARLDPISDCPYLFGAPRFLWRGVIELGLRHGLNALRDPRRRFETGRRLHHVLGAIAEYRAVRRERG